MVRVETQLEHTANRENLSELKSEMFKWMFGTILVSGIAVIAALVRTFIK